MTKVISIVVLVSVIINLGLFGIPFIKGINLIGPKPAYAAEGEISESTQWIIAGAILMYYLFFRKEPAKSPEETTIIKGFVAPAIAPFKIGEEVKINKTYKVRNAWAVTLDSYELFEGEAIEFNFLVENIQKEVAQCELTTNTYLMDRQGNKYHDSHISKTGKREYIPNVSVENKVSFFNLTENIEALILYLNFEGRILTENQWETKELFFGPIK